MENLNLAGVDRAYVCAALSPNRVFFTHCALRLKKSGTVVPRMELEEVGPSMDFVLRRHRPPNESLRKEAMKTSREKPKKKVGNMSKSLWFICLCKVKLYLNCVLVLLLTGEEC